MFAARRDARAFLDAGLLRIPLNRERRVDSTNPLKTGSQTRLIAYLAVFVVIAWASAFPAIKVSLTEYSPVQLSCLRYLVASCALVFLTWGRISRLPSMQDALRFMLCGILGISVYNVAVAYGETRVPAGVASLLVSMAPLFAAALAHFLLKDSLGRYGWLGLSVSLSGVLVISIGQGFAAKFDLGAAAMLAAAIVQGVAIVLQKPLFSKYSAIEVTAYTVWAASLSMLGVLPSVAQTALIARLETTLAVVYLGVVPAALGILAWSYILARVPAAKAASLLYVVPVASLVVSWLWLSEVPSFLAIIGGGLSLAGVALASRRSASARQQ